MSGLKKSRGGKRVGAGRPRERKGGQTTVKIWSATAELLDVIAVRLGLRTRQQAVDHLAEKACAELSIDVPRETEEK